jgi:hypothetical protein
MSTPLADNLSAKAKMFITAGLKSGDTQYHAIADCLNTIAENGDGQETDEFLHVCAEELVHYSQAAVKFLNPEPPAPKWTVFCQEESGEGTIWIEAVEAIKAEHAKTVGRQECAEQWGYPEDTIHVLGVAKGDINIAFWEDHCNRKPADEE